jgi:hypothetical protein
VVVPNYDGLGSAVAAGIIADDAGNDHGIADIPYWLDSAYECRVEDWTIRIGGDTSGGGITIVVARTPVAIILWLA